MSEDRTGQQKGLLARLTQAFVDEPRSREELLEELRAAADDHVLDQEALSIMEGAMQVADMQVRDIMIPRSQMVVVESDKTAREFLPTIIDEGHSRFPVIGDNPDEVVGILLAKDLLPAILEGDLDKFDLSSRLRKPTFIPESKRLNVLLKEFRSTRNHMAIVLDEYGCVSGLVTIEDVLEQIVGEIEDEHDVEEDDGFIRTVNGGAFMVKALTPIDDFNDYFRTELSDQEFDTIGGLVTQQFGHLPQRDESIEFSGFEFSVVSADDRRIRLLKVSPL